MGGFRNQLLENMKENFYFPTFLTLNSLFTSENLLPLTFWVTFQLNLWQNINEELEYLIKLSQYFRNLAEAAMRLYNKTFFSKAFKVLADFNELFNFEKFLIYVLPKI